MLSELENIDANLAKSIVNLFEDDFTIPFLCRYRKDLIQNLSPDRLRDIKGTIVIVKSIESKTKSLLKSLQKQNLLTIELSKSIRAARTLDELEHISLLYKPESKGSLYERAQKHGLQPIANEILYGCRKVSTSNFLKPNSNGLETIESVEKCIKDIVSHLMLKNEFVLNEVRVLKSRYSIFVKTSKRKQKADKAKQKNNAKSHDATKFETYFEFSSPVDHLKAHQILAINRGESLKILKVKYEIDSLFTKNLKEFVMRTFSKQNQKLISEAFDDSSSKKITQFVERQTKSELMKRAEKAAIEVFAENLKNLLLVNPIKGCKILGIDPGFTSGCKIALISESGDVLETGHVIYPHIKTKLKNAIDTVTTLLTNYDCKLIAIGNGTACRETENFISDLMDKNIVDKKTVNYCIVSEQGASIYSCSDIAKKEFPNTDVSLIGAISIARRLLDPLSELVKIEPKHLGVGMYQHDLNEKSLKSTLDDIVTECVSYVGVDINKASLSLLKRIAGLSEKKAASILEYRSENGPFKSREELLKVKSIGAKSFAQCAGFVRINPLKADIIDYYNPLDSTNVHPESYDLAKLIIQDAGMKLKEIGSQKCIAAMQKYKERNDIEDVALKFNENSARVSEMNNQNSETDFNVKFFS